MKKILFGLAIVVMLSSCGAESVVSSYMNACISNGNTSQYVTRDTGVISDYLVLDYEIGRTIVGKTFKTIIVKVTFKSKANTDLIKTFKFLVADNDNKIHDIY